MAAGPSGAVISNADGRLELFALGPGGQIDHIWQHSPNGLWSTWQSVAGLPVGVSFFAFEIARNADGRLEVFALAESSSHLYHSWQVGAGGAWVPWQDTGQVLGVFDVAANPDGRLEIIGVGGGGTTGQIIHSWQLAPNSGWSGWSLLNSPPAFDVYQVQIAQNADGRLEVFVGRGDGLTMHAWQVALNSAWSNWGFLNLPPSRHFFAVGVNADGRLELFLPFDDALAHVWQTRPNGAWSGAAALFTYPDPGDDWYVFPAAGFNADGRVEVYVDLPDALYHVWQTAPNAGWGAPRQLDSADPTAIWGVGRNPDGRQEIFYATRSGGLGHRWQLSPNGAWSPFTFLG
jgi:hypothetical protein